MVSQILFTDKRFDAKNESNYMYELTKNTIILCTNQELLCSLGQEILDTINDKTKNCYDCDVKDVGKAKIIIRNRLHMVIDVNGQTITLCLEPAMVYKAKEIDDIWFFTKVKINGNYKECIYPLSSFEGTEKVWKAGGLNSIYLGIVCGRYGTFGEFTTN